MAVIFQSFLFNEINLFSFGLTDRLSDFNSFLIDHYARVLIEISGVFNLFIVLFNFLFFFLW